jgi:hypothetical protein
LTIPNTEKQQIKPTFARLRPLFFISAAKKISHGFFRVAPLDTDFPLEFKIVSKQDVWQLISIFIDELAFKK